MWGYCYIPFQPKNNKEAAGWRIRLVSHPSRKNKNAARVGPPAYLELSNPWSPNARDQGHPHTCLG
jgi:hypothetical protein